MGLRHGAMTSSVVVTATTATVLPKKCGSSERRGVGYAPLGATPLGALPAPWQRRTRAVVAGWWQWHRHDRTLTSAPHPADRPDAEAVA